MATVMPYMASVAISASDSGGSLSGILGCISIVAWICLLLPQLVTNYKTKSAEGLSMGFLFIWLFGDVANLAGALVTNLTPSAIAIGCYFCIADTVLISQSLYYNAINARRKMRANQVLPEQAQADEEEPLLARSRSGSPKISESRSESVEKEEPRRRPWVANTLSLVAVYALGTAAWFGSRQVLPSDGAGADDPAPSDPADGGSKAPVLVLGIALGYLSAVLYLCARMPQIYLNWRKKSTDGLSMLFFLLSLTGNLTYGASLVAYSQDGDYLLRALPWLVGSLGTIVEDAIVFLQFNLYSNQVKAGDDARSTPYVAEEAW